MNRPVFSIRCGLALGLNQVGYSVISMTHSAFGGIGGDVALQQTVIHRRSRPLARTTTPFAHSGRLQTLLAAQPPHPRLTNGVTGPIEVVGQESV